MRRKSSKTLVFVLFFLSGATGLIYELVWTRELIFVFGGTTYAITTVLVAFMGGLGLGSFLAGRFGDRLQQPGKLYGAIEIAIGFYALAVPLLLELAEPLYRALYPQMVDRQWLLTMTRFCVGGLVLITPTICMGATLPILVRHVTMQGSGLGASVGLLYGINAGGAVAGVLATGFWLIPTMGLNNTTLVAAGLNVAIGLVAIFFLRSVEQRDEAHTFQAPEPVPRRSTPQVQRTILAVFAVSGFSAMVYQIMWTRALIVSIGSSTYSFTCILAAFILGLSLGSLAIAHVADRWRNPPLVIGILQLFIGLAAVSVSPIYGYAPVVVHKLVLNFKHNYDLLLAFEFLLIIVVTFLPTFLMGALFPLVTRALTRQAGATSEPTGRAYAVNTIGTILGSFCGGFLMIDLIGSQASIVLAALLNGVAGAWLIRVTWLSQGNRYRRAHLAQFAWLPIPVIAFLVGPWDRVLMSAGSFIEGDHPRTKLAGFNIEYFGEDPDLTVVVTSSKQDKDSLSLLVNAKPDASTDRSDMMTMILLGHLPALLMPDRPNQVCVVGLGSGLTVGALARHPEVEQIDCIELSREVALAARLFTPFNHGVLLNDPRVRLIRADGRNHLAYTNQVYDVIVSQPSNPWIAGVSSLFTREYFELAKNRLSQDGLFCCWIQGYSVTQDDFRLIVRTLANTFEFTSIWELAGNDYVLIAGNRPFAVPLDQVRRRFESQHVDSNGQLSFPVREDLYRVNMIRLDKLLGRFLTTGSALETWTGDGKIHTDDNALLEFSAPKHLYIEEGAEILAALTAQRRSPFDEVISIRTEAPNHQRLMARVDTVVEARQARLLRYDVDRIRRDPLGVWSALLTAYELDPGDLEIYLLIVDLRRDIKRYHPDLEQSPQGQQLSARLNEMRSPMWLPRTGVTLNAVMTALRKHAVEVARDDRWKAAAQYLAEALELEPDDGETIIELALASHMAGATDTAIRELEAALKKRLFSIDALVNNDRLAPLRAHQDFAKMLRFYQSSTR